MSEGFPRGVVGAMNLGVTVRAAPVEGEDVMTGYGMVPHQHLHMTCLTEDGRSSLQKVQVIRPVWHVAGVAVLARRRVLPQERSTFFGMAFVAKLRG